MLVRYDPHVRCAGSARGSWPIVAPVSECRAHGLTPAAATAASLGGAHYVSAGAVGFARGVNVTPKLLALLLPAQALLPTGVALMLVAAVMACRYASTRVLNRWGVQGNEKPPGRRDCDCLRPRVTHRTCRRRRGLSMRELPPPGASAALEAGKGLRSSRLGRLNPREPRPPPVPSGEGPSPREHGASPSPRALTSSARN